MNRLIVISGPSGIGKTPLLRALRRYYPDPFASMPSVVLYNSREPRPGETDGEDYQFRSREEVAALEGDERYVTIKARSDLQALDLKMLQNQLRTGDVLYEGNPCAARVLLHENKLLETRRLGVFIAPVSADEIADLRAVPDGDLREVIVEMMRRKLTRRAEAMYGTLTQERQEDIDHRAACAWQELHEAHRFDWVVPNHDGEDSENWEAFGCPVGDARRTLTAVADLVRGGESPQAEKWSRALLP